MAQYLYSISNDTLNAAFDTDLFVEEFSASAIASEITLIETVNDNIYIDTTTTLSGGDETILDALMSAHTATITLQRRAFISGSTTTTSLSDTLMNGMTLTPELGVYLAVFSSTLRVNENSVDCYVSMYVGGIKEDESEVTLRRQNGTRMPTSIPMFEITVDGTQAVEVRWRTESGTLTSHEFRRLELYKVG